ncbi:MAG TPA: DUF4097 family beta strand repeat-containing protein [Opitutaceae bacterium]|nr:DUF4097 family beta strand repeat-containing protein [Opitutaceae bacterium]
MNSLSRMFLVVAFAATAVTASAKIERVVEKTFAVTGAGTLRVETYGGSIQVTPASDGVVKVTARERIRADSDAEADDLLKKLELTLEQSGSDVRAKAKYESQPFGFHFGSWPPVQVDFVVAVPASFATELHTSGGSITVGDLAGKVFARTSGGSIKLGKIGAPIDAHTSGGNITLDRAAGDVELETSGGNISVGQVAGAAKLSTSGGGIKIDEVRNSIDAHTSGGSVHAAVAGPLKGDCVLSTSGGSIQVAVDQAAAFRLDASTSGGSVDADGLTIALESSGHNRAKLVGNVNGGGPLLRLRTSGGGIAVRTR